MKSNFQFLKNEWHAFFQRAAKAEKLVITDPRTSLTYARMALEVGVNGMYINDHALEMPYNNSLDSLIKNYAFRQQVNPKLYDDIHIIRKVGNLAIHNNSVSLYDSEHVILKLFYFCKWFAHTYSTTDEKPGNSFDFEIIPKEGPEALSKRQLNNLQKKLDNDLKIYQKELERVAQQQKELEEKNKLLELQLQKAREQIEQQKVFANEQDHIHHPRNEKETRKYFIDISLREAGWDLKGVNDKEYKVKYMPASTNKTETGYVDYVLWDDDSKPLALVEAKKAMVNARTGENQAQLYADSLEKMHGQRPVMYYSNGFETYLWDDCFYKQARKVQGFCTKSELQTLIYRRKNRKDKAIFEYFDAIFLGLTATPKSHVDKNTFEAFDLPDKSPTDEYSFEEAVTNKHLVPYQSIEVPTKFRTKGIKYKDLS
jgi:type I restriction enzyme, R subunit